MITTRSFGGLMVGLLFMLLTAALLILVGFVGIGSGVMQVVLIISGMTAMGALAAFRSFMDGSSETPLIRISFNEMLLSSTISGGIPKSEGSSPQPERGSRVRPAPWELTAGQLIGVDNALALARLRMDIEAELRRIAHETHLDLSVRPVGLLSLARELVDKDVVPVVFLEALRNVNAVCNRGIHGEGVPNDLAASVVRVGVQVLERLRLFPTTSSNGEQYHTISINPD